MIGEREPSADSGLAISASEFAKIRDMLHAGFGIKLAEEKRVTFASAPSPCPPNIYAESFAGNGHWKNNIDVDWANAESPHTGTRAGTNSIR